MNCELEKGFAFRALAIIYLRALVKPYLIENKKIFRLVMQYSMLVDLQLFLEHCCLLVLAFVFQCNQFKRK